MNLKKLDQIKAPDDWINSVLNPNKNINRKPMTSGIVFRKRTFKVAATLLAVLFVFGSCFTAAALSSDTFMDFLSKVFGKQKITKVEMVNKKTKIKTDKKGFLKTDENIFVVGENESFICEYHWKDDKEVVDNVYIIKNNDLVKLSEKHFSGKYDGKDFSFDYVINNNEIYGYNYSGDLENIFFKIKNDTVYATFLTVKKDTVIKGSIASINLKNKTIVKISNDKMICNFIMSPNGDYILCNHRSKGYWSCFDISQKSDKKISSKLINGYNRTNEIKFIDSNRILTLGEPYISNNTEIYTTNLINLKTLKCEKIYKNSGNITVDWSYKLNKDKLTIFNITNKEKFTVPDVKNIIQPLDISKNYVLFSDEENNADCYLVDLNKHSYIKFNMPDEMKSKIEIHLDGNSKKALLTNGEKDYLLDLCSL